MSAGPRIQSVGFAAGLRWLPAGAELLFSALGPMAGVASLWLLVSLIAMVIPVIGQIVLVLLTPLLTAGVLAAFDTVRGGSRPLPTVLFAGWRDPVRRRTLLVIGAFSLAGSMLAAMILIGWIGNQLGQDELEAAMRSQETLIQALSGVSIGGGLHAGRAGVQPGAGRNLLRHTAGHVRPLADPASPDDQLQGGAVQLGRLPRLRPGLPGVRRRARPDPGPDDLGRRAGPGRLRPIPWPGAVPGHDHVRSDPDGRDPVRRLQPDLRLAAGNRHSPPGEHGPDQDDRVDL
jgi:hypothetical protein